MRRRIKAAMDEHQAGIVALIHRTDVALNLGRLAGQEALAQVRRETVRRMRAYQQFKHVKIFDPMVEFGTPEQQQSAARMRERCLAAGEAFMDHMQRWPMHEVVKGWDAYRRSVNAMTAAMRLHLAREQREVPLLFELGEPVRRSA